MIAQKPMKHTSRKVIAVRINSFGFLAGAILLTSVYGLGAPCFAAENPFQDGLTTRRLDSTEAAKIKQYAVTSESILRLALADSENRSPEETRSLLAKAIHEVVPESFNSQGRVELLFRMALNQGLDLAKNYLNRDTDIELIAAILKRSTSIALTLYPKDLEAIRTKTLIDLPYPVLAQLMLRASEEWLTGVKGLENQIQFLRRSLEFWNLTLLQEEHLSRLKFARLIDRVVTVLDRDSKVSSKGVARTAAEEYSVLLNLIDDVLKDHTLNLLAVEYTPQCSAQTRVNTRCATSKGSLLRYVSATGNTGWRVDRRGALWNEQARPVGGNYASVKSACQLDQSAVPSYTDFQRAWAEGLDEVVPALRQETEFWTSNQEPDAECNYVYDFNLHRIGTCMNRAKNRYSTICVRRIL